MILNSEIFYLWYCKLQEDFECLAFFWRGPGPSGPFSTLTAPILSAPPKFYIILWPHKSWVSTDLCA